MNTTWLKRLYYRWLALATEGSLDDERGNGQPDWERIKRLEAELVHARQRSL